MIDRIIEYSIRHRFAVIAAATLLGLWGAIEAANTPVDAIPDLSENQVIVFAGWPGHSPREVESQVSYPLSVRLQGLPGVRVIRSSSEFGFAFLSVIFEDAIQLSEGRRQVAARLDEIVGAAGADGGLPPGVVPRLGPDAAATGQIFWYTVEGEGYDPGRLRALQDWYVKPQLASVPGVAEVASVGGSPIEYQVNVRPDLLRAKGISLAEVIRAVEASNGAVGGNVVQRGNAEFLVLSSGWLGALPSSDGEDSFDPSQARRDLENAVIATVDGVTLRVGDVASVAVGPQARRGVLEKDGNEVTGGVVLMARGENPLQVTRRIKDRIRALHAGLPHGVKIIPFYDRTPLIHGAIETVTGAVLEAVITASACVLLVLLHVRAAFVIASTLPLAALGSFALLGLFRRLGALDVETNTMSLAGIAISVGVLVDSSIVMTENAMHSLRERFGDHPVNGDVRGVLLPACRAVGRPIFFSVVIMLLSFLPVFALGGMEGKMFRPLAYTKSFALLSVAVLAVTLVPALCTMLLKGRIRGETESWLVRTVYEVYRPVLGFLLDHPAPLVWVLAATFVLGLAPLGSRVVFLAALFVGLLAVGLATRGWRSRLVAMSALVLVGLGADMLIDPLPRAFLTALDEGMVMDMPITIPRASITESADDLKARDMVLCHFPEVDMVVGKAGRAETATDPAPVDMIETMVNLRAREFWPRRVLRRDDALRLMGRALGVLEKRKLVEGIERNARAALLDGAVEAVLPQFDVAMREYAHQRNRELDRALGGTVTDSDDPRFPEHRSRWQTHVRELDDELIVRAAGTFARLAIEELLLKAKSADPQAANAVRKVRALRERVPSPLARHPGGGSAAAGAGVGHHHAATSADWLDLEPQPALDAAQVELAGAFESSITLWRRERSELLGFEGELDRAVRMPGWTNVWTMPIQNRVDMLATGVNTNVGVRVLGRSLEGVVRASEAIAEVVKRVPGAADVVADPVRGKGYLDIRVDRAKSSRLGVRVADLNEAVETSIGGKQAATIVQGRERYPVRVRYARDFREDEISIRDVLVPLAGSKPGEGRRFVPLSDVADISITEGPATIKSENGLLRNYVRVNVRGRDAVDFVAEARRVVSRSVQLPEGIFLEWTGQFEHEARAQRTLAWIVPAVIALIFLVLYWTYLDFADAALMMLAVPGSLAGGVFVQWLWGEPFTVTIWVGYIACFGMATATGIIMLVYLREALAKAGGLESLSAEGLRRAVLDGAAQRLRPKLLTEGTVLLGLGPMLWASGVGAEVIRPMAAPVLGGILVADEVIDLLIPVAFYQVRKWRWKRLHGDTPRFLGPAETRGLEPIGVERDPGYRK
jgi:Cu(I)/Ag(I) efflux system membrane protein CusA/SilA